MNKAILALIMAGALAGCNSEGGSSGIPEPRPSGSVSGVAFDGLITNGDVKVYAWDGEQGELLGEGETDSAGEYSVELDQVPSQTVLIEVQGGRYDEEASGRSVALRSGDFLRAVYDYSQGEEISVSLTYYTTLAAGLADYMVSTGTSPQKAVEKSNTTISDLVGLDIREVVPLEIVDSANATPVVTDQHLYGFATAAISQLTQWISEQNSQPTHKEYNSIKFAAAAYHDIKADGLLDGSGSNGVVAQGIVKLNPDIYRNRIATNMLVMANSEVNVTNLNPSDILSMAQDFNKSNSALFAGAEQIALDQNEPAITNVSHSDEQTVAGVIDFGADIVDLVGLEEVSLYIDGTLHDFQGGESSPSFQIDTVGLADGLRDLEIRARNVAGGTASHLVTVNVSNYGIEISELSPEDGEYVSGMTSFSALVTDASGIRDVRYVFTDGETYLFTDDDASEPSKSLDTTRWPDGSRKLQLVATNNVGIEVEHEITFYVDNEPPVASLDPEDGDVLEGVASITGDVDDNQGISSTKLFINGEEVATFDSSSIGHQVDTKKFPEGETNLVLEVVDRAGNITRDKKVVYFDNNPPEVDIANVSIRENDIKMLAVRADVFDRAGIQKVELLIDDEVVITDTSVGVDGIFDHVVDLEAGGYGNGSHRLEVLVTDGSGRRASDTKTFYAIHNAPEVRIEMGEQECRTRDDGQRYCRGYWTYNLRVTNAAPSKNYEISKAVLHNVEPYYGSSSVPSTATIGGQRFTVQGNLIKYSSLHSLETPCRASYYWGDMKVTVMDSDGLSRNLTVNNVYACAQP